LVIRILSFFTQKGLRFALRDQAKTIAAGVIAKILPNQVKETKKKVVPG